MSRKKAIELIDQLRRDVEALGLGERQAGAWLRDRSEDLDTELTKTRPFVAFRNAWFFGPDGSGSAPLGQLTSWVVREVMNGNDSRSILAAAAAELAENECRLIEVIPIFGVSIPTAVELQRGVTLTPIEGIPRSWREQRAANSLDPGRFEMPSECLLLQEVTVKPAFKRRRSMSTAVAVDDASTAPTINERSTVHTLVRASFLLLGTSPVEMRAMRYFHSGNRFIGSVGGARGILSPHFTFSRNEFEPTKVKATFDKLLKFKDSPSLMRAIDRVGRSRTNKTVHDKAIDLGMALEIALLHGASSGNTEIRYKVSSRAAWLVGTDFKSRLQASQLAKDLYDSRSSAVHTGLLSGRAGRAFNSETSDKFVQDLLVRILERGEFPNWDRLILGG